MLARDGGEGYGQLGVLQPSQLILPVLQSNLLGSLHGAVEVVHAAITCANLASLKGIAGLATNIIPQGCVLDPPPLSTFRYFRYFEVLLGHVEPPHKDNQQVLMNMNDVGLYLEH